MDSVVKIILGVLLFAVLLGVLFGCIYLYWWAITIIFNFVATSCGWSFQTNVWLTGCILIVLETIGSALGFKKTTTTTEK